MKPPKDDEFNAYPFSRREGKSLLPEPMQLEYVPHKFRQLVWRELESDIHEQSKRRSATTRNYRRHNSMEHILFRYRFEILELPHDDAHFSHWDGKADPEADKSWVKNHIFGGDYHEVLGLIEFIIRQPTCSKCLRTRLVSLFDNTAIAYVVDSVGGALTILPRFSSEAGVATQEAIQSLAQSEMEGASAHLRHAAMEIQEKQYAKSVVDSIHAVESVARKIDHRSSSTLGPALDSLQSAGLLKHAVLKDAFKKLYGYTSDEQGLRHALVRQSSPEVGLDEAVFMFGACACFAGYLANKYRARQE